MPRRLIQLFTGLVLYGVSDSMLLLAGLGVDPWDVLHQGLARRTGVPVGTWAIIVGAAVLLLWIPLRQRPGLGTLCNVVLVGAVIDGVLAAVTPPHSLAVRATVMVSGVALNGWRPALHRRGPRTRSPRRVDDRVRGPRPFTAAGADLHRGDGAAGRLAARRHRRYRHAGLRGLHRATRARLVPLFTRSAPARSARTSTSASP